MRWITLQEYIYAVLQEAYCWVRWVGIVSGRVLISGVRVANYLTRPSSSRLLMIVRM